MIIACSTLMISCDNWLEVKRRANFSSLRKAIRKCSMAFISI